MHLVGTSILEYYYDARTHVYLKKNIFSSSSKQIAFNHIPHFNIAIIPKCGTNCVVYIHFANLKPTRSLNSDVSVYVNLFPANVGLAVLYEKCLFKDRFCEDH